LCDGEQRVFVYGQWEGNGDGNENQNENENQNVVAIAFLAATPFDCDFY